MDTAFEIIAKYARQLGLAIPPVTADGKEPQPFIWLGKEANNSRGQAFPCAYPPSVVYRSKRLTTAVFVAAQGQQPVAPALDAAARVRMLSLAPAHTYADCARRCGQGCGVLWRGGSRGARDE